MVIAKAEATLLPVTGLVASVVPLVVPFVVLLFVFVSLLSFQSYALHRSYLENAHTLLPGVCTVSLMIEGR